jgi:hypothetical protein
MKLLANALEGIAACDGTGPQKGVVAQSGANVIVEAFNWVVAVSTCALRFEVVAGAVDPSCERRRRLTIKCKRGD